MNRAALFAGAIGLTALLIARNIDMPLLVRPNVPAPVIPDGYRRMTGKEVTAANGKMAQKLLALPYGAVQEFVDEQGRHLLGALETHFHEVGGAAKPWGWHKGVSLYIKPEEPSETPA